MADNSTSIIEIVSHSAFIQGIEGGISKATGLSQVWVDFQYIYCLLVMRDEIKYAEGSGRCKRNKQP
jgi:acid phosphatase family membrane protein YuiD